MKRLRGALSRALFSTGKRSWHGAAKAARTAGLPVCTSIAAAAVAAHAPNIHPQCYGWKMWESVSETIAATS